MRKIIGVPSRIPPLQRSPALLGALLLGAFVLGGAVQAGPGRDLSSFNRNLRAENEKRSGRLDSHGT